MVFVFEFVYVLDYVDGFLYIKQSPNTWDEAYLIMMDDHFDSCSGIWFVRILLSSFASIFKREIGLTFSLCWVFVWFRYQSNCSFIE